MKKSIFPIILIVIFLILSGGLFVVNEKEQAVIIQFGKPVGNTITDAGLKFKTPIIQTVIKFDKRILEWDGAANEIPTKDNKYIFIDAFARWRIVDALQFFKSAKNEMLAQSRLDDIIDGAVRDEITNRNMNEIIRSTQRQMQTSEDEEEGSLDTEGSDSNLSEGARLDIIKSIQSNVKSRLTELQMGIEVVDIQLKRINYNKQVQSKLFNRMISEQNMIAEKYRGQGQGKKQEILGMQIQKSKEVRSQAYLEAQIIKGDADAEAVSIYANAYNKSPEFYNFKKSLETYTKTLDSTTKVIMSTDGKYFKYLTQ
ncbi:MAG: protease modulator HflC [Candidatus Marinimicrobia bacterium]|nr:protease modulator HflC [Candidatus Neomarinimicrobiota bacterium]